MGDVASIRVVAAGGADTIRAGAAAVALLQVEGGTGGDTLMFLGGDVVCDLTAGATPRVRGVEMLDIGGGGANRLVRRHDIEEPGAVAGNSVGSH